MARRRNKKVSTVQIWMIVVSLVIYLGIAFVIWIVMMRIASFGIDIQSIIKII